MARITSRPASPSGTSLPAQTGNGGKFLQTDGTATSWATAGTSLAALTPTATKTAPYTAVVGDLAMMNVAGGGNVLNLPAAPADKAQVGYNAIGATFLVPLTINAGGSDTIGTSGLTSASIPLAGEVNVFQYQASSTRWVSVANVKPLAALDARHKTRLPQFEGRQLWTFGHSYIAGSGAGDWSRRLYDRHNPQSANFATRAAAGTTAGGMADQLRQLSFTSNGSAGATITGYAICQSMINNANSSMASATVVEEYRSCFALLANVRLGITTTAFVFGSGWTSGVTTTASSYFDFSFKGDTAYLLMAFTTAAATVTVSHSGTGGAIQQTVNTGGYAEAFPGVVKLSGYGPGFHTVRVTHASGSGQTVYFGLQAATSVPTVLWAQEGPIPSYSGAQNTLLTTTYPNAVAAILSDFPNVIAVPYGSGWDQTTMVYSDNVHLNERGVTYWADRVEAVIAALDYAQGRNVMTATGAAAYNTPLPSAAGYSASTLDVSATYVNLKAWTSNNQWIYSLSPDTNFPTVPVGSGLVITGGSGWAAGTYYINSVNVNFGTPDGTRTMYQIGSPQTPPATAGVAGGAGYVTV